MSRRRPDWVAIWLYALLTTVVALVVLRIMQDADACDHRGGVLARGAWGWPVCVAVPVKP